MLKANMIDWKYIVTHLASFVVLSMGVVLATVAPEKQFPTYVVLLLMGAVSLASGSSNMGLVRRIKLLESRLEQSNAKNKSE